MVKRVGVLLFLLLLVPLGAWGIAGGVQSHLEGLWRQAIATEVGPERAPGFVFEVPLTTACTLRDQPEGLVQICSRYRLMTWMSRGAIATAAVGLELLALIAILGWQARRNLSLLWQVFDHGLQATLLALALLVTLHGVLAAGALYLFMTTFGSHIYPYQLGLIGVGAAFGVVTMIRACVRVLSHSSGGKLALSLDPGAHPEIWSFVTDLAERLGTAPPRQIIVGLEPNFFVTEGRLQTPYGGVDGRTLYLSLPLCRILERDELAAVIGHELGHFRGADTEFSQRFYPIYRRAGDALAELRRAGGDARALALWPAQYMLSFFLDAFAAAERAESRERELLADQAGAEVAGPRALGLLLMKITLFSSLWPLLRAALPESRADGANLSVRFADLAVKLAGPALLHDLDQRRIPHPFDSHPPLALRLQALGCTADDLREAALQATPADGALRLLPGAADLEQELTLLAVHFGVL